MATKRMFSLQVVDTDKFMDMSTSAQALYFHLGMHGDDDGFVASPRKIARSAGCNDDDVKLLAAKGFIIPFDSGVVVITDWKLNNSIKTDRYTPTIYQEERAMLQAETTGRYRFGTKMDPNRFQNGSKVVPQDSIDKSSIEESMEADKPPAPAKPVRKSFGEFGWVKLTEDEYSCLLNDLGEAEAKRCITYVDESAEATGNKNKWRSWNLVVRKCHRDKWGLNSRKEQENGKTEPKPLWKVGTVV